MSKSDDQPVPIAVLFSCDPEGDKHTCDRLVGLHPDGTDPITWAHALKASVEDDFPDWLWAITGNDAAGELRSDYLVRSVLGESARG